MPKWTLRSHCKKIYGAACNGDETALADIRAFVQSLKNSRYKKRWQLNKLAKGKTMKLITWPIALIIAVVALTGCAGRITPQGAAGLTTAAVYAFGRNNPKIVATMRQIQPAACEIARNPGATVEDVVGVIENSAGVNPDTKAIINVLLAIYQTSTYPAHTNQAQSRPYLEAVICPGWAGGLALLPAPGVDASRNAAPVKRWILIK